jgi:hypothetical protein
MMQQKDVSKALKFNPFCNNNRCSFIINFHPLIKGCSYVPDSLKCHQYCHLINELLEPLESRAH